MAGIDDFFKGGNLVTGAAIAVGAMVLLPVARSVLRPIAKTVVKGGLVAYDGVSRMVTEASEELSDMTAEARNELATRDKRTMAQAGDKPPPAATVGSPSPASGAMTAAGTGGVADKGHDKDKPGAKP